MKKFLAALLLAIAVVPAPAVFAQQAAQQQKNVAEQFGQFTPSESDASVQFLREAFGSVISLIHPGSKLAGERVHDPLAAGMKIFNAGALFLGMLFLVYTTLRGTIDSAHDAEILGRRMNSMWVPLRTLGGAVAIAPGPSGYSLVQIAVLWIAVQGAGMADHIWGGIMDHLATDSMIAMPAVPQARSLAASVLKSEVCRAAMNAHFEETGRNDRIQVREIQQKVVNKGEGLGLADMLASPLIGMMRRAASTVGTSYQVTEYRWDGGRYLSGEPPCGALRWSESDESKGGNSNVAVDKAPILQAHAAAVRQMILFLRPTAALIVEGKAPPPGVIDDAARTYEEVLRRGAQIAVEDSNEKAKKSFIEFAKDGGWIYAGTYYGDIIRLNDSMQSAINSLPTPEPITITNKEMPEELQKLFDSLIVVEEYIKNRSTAPERAYDARTDWEAEAKKPLTGWADIRRLASLPALGAINAWTQSMAGSNLSHMSQMKSLGDTIVTTAWATMGAMAIAAGVADSLAVQLTVGVVFDAGAALGVFGGLVTSMATLLMLGGLMLAFYVPLIPYIAWLVALIKWLVMVAENVLAAPIWAAAHIHPDGGEMSGKGGPGYFIILSTFLRPSLMVFGFLFGILLAQPVTGWINATYITAVAGAMGDSFNGLGAMVAYTVIYALIMTIVVHSLFSLVNYLPDNVLRWLGHAVGAGAIGDKESDQTSRVFGAAVQGGAAGGVAGAGAAKAALSKSAAEKKESAATRDQRQAEHLG